MAELSELLIAACSFITNVFVAGAAYTEGRRGPGVPQPDHADLRPHPGLGQGQRADEPVL